MRTLTTRPDDSAPMAFIHPHDRAVLEERWRIAFESGAPLEMEFRMRFPKQPEFRWYLGRTVPVRDDRGHVIRWYGTSTDIDVQKRVESALARSQERLRAALDAAETGTFRWDLRTNALDWDANLARLFGLSSNAAIEKFDDFIALVHPEDRARVAAACDRCRDRGADFDEDFRVRWPNGEVRWLHDKARMYRGADGLPHYLSGACVDVTERRQKEEALVEADRQKDEFLGMLAHELRNPLAPLVYAVASLEQRLPDEKSRKTLDVMSRQVSRISRLVDDLLDVSRVAQGKIALQMQPLDLAVVVRDAVDAVRPGIIERHQQLVLALDDQVMVSGDALRLGQVLVNLLNNAVKYTPEGGRISVSLVGESGAATIRVSDTGIGMSAEMLPRVFDLFVQADSSLTHSQGGLGIGLALVSRLTRLHGGTVTAHSDGPSRGSEFVIRLPLVAPRAIETRA
jgi:PAS domain S-box-containing protein